MQRLLKKYDGDWLKVVTNHIRVIRLTHSDILEATPIPELSALMESYALVTVALLNLLKCSN